MSEPGARNCPFCGENFTVAIRFPASKYSERYAAVVCDKCEAVGPPVYVKYLSSWNTDTTRWLAVTAWNKREEPAK